MRWLDGIIDSMAMSLGKLWDSEEQGSQTCCSPRYHKEAGTTQQLNNNKWKETKKIAFEAVMEIDRYVKNDKIF